MSILVWIIFALICQVLVEWISALWKGIDARKYKTNPVAEATKKNLAFVTVLIPAWQEGAALSRCLASLLSIRYPAWEAIVIAGGNDGTYETAVEFCEPHANFSVIRQPPLGKNHALNLGLSASKGEIIALLDADTTVGQDWLASLVGPLTGQSRASTGKALPRRRTPVSMSELMERLSAYEIHRTVVLQGSASIAIRRQVIEQLGGFPDQVYVGVDWDLDARLKSLGVKPAYCPQAIVHTERPATLKEYWANEVRWRRAHLQSILRLPQNFLAPPIKAFASLYLYALAWGLFVFSLLSVLALPFGFDQPALLWLTVLIWLALRRVSLALEVAAYSRDFHWLSYAWTPPLLLLLTLMAIIPATLTLNRQPRQFKGARSHSGG